MVREDRRVFVVPVPALEVFSSEARCSGEQGVWGEGVGGWESVDEETDLFSFFLHFLFFFWYLQIWCSVLATLC